jgi:hypothetical protein
VFDDRIASAWTPMTNAAPTTAAMIWATSRVRFGPSVRKSVTVSATDKAVAERPMATTTP